MPGPGGLLAFGAMWEGNTTCVRCKRPLRDKGKFCMQGTVTGRLGSSLPSIGASKVVVFYCDRRWCRFVRWLKGLWNE